MAARSSTPIWALGQIAPGSGRNGGWSCSARRVDLYSDDSNTLRFAPPPAVKMDSTVEAVV